MFFLVSSQFYTHGEEFWNAFTLHLLVGDAEQRALTKQRQET